MEYSVKENVNDRTIHEQNICEIQDIIEKIKSTNRYTGKKERKENPRLKAHAFSTKS